ncbi:MAG: hypothetical protein JWP50_1524 [Phenylobacterium sp.]|nr:hypothetical protein [Phenylobacterium sp.]
MEFGANYPVVGKVPLARTLLELAEYRGSFGVPLVSKRREGIAAMLPPYARPRKGAFPEWKRRYIEDNRSFYVRHKEVIDPWLPLIADFPPSFQKLEWNWKAGPREINRALVQFRASGVRVRNPASAPSLVALTESQVPIVPWEDRYMTPRECARLQSMGNLRALPPKEIDAYRALGNAVNVTVIDEVCRALVAAKL